MAEPGFVAVIPGSGEIMMHAGFRLPPGIDDGAALVADSFVYQIQASGLIGSPTVPISRSDDKFVLRRAFPCPSA